MSFRHAVELLRNEHPALSAPLTHVVKKATTEAVKLPSVFQTSADDQAVLQQVLTYYHDTLKQSPEALKYLQRRRLNHDEFFTSQRPSGVRAGAQRFGIRFCLSAPQILTP
ncbi:MAG TPA: hypothetical protein VG675_13535 [Bryobacteraceae bacterium]|nr:hypothetical protein [Bryobacteraceae bacterium]